MKLNTKNKRFRIKISAWVLFNKFQNIEMTEIGLTYILRNVLLDHFDRNSDSRKRLCYCLKAVIYDLFRLQRFCCNQ